MRAGGKFLIACVVLFFSTLTSAALAVDASSVLVVYNTYDPTPGDGLLSEGQQIADYYRDTYNLAPSQLLGLNLGPVSNTISAQQYLSSIRQPILGALTPSTDLIITTRGMPLKIQVSQPNPATYIDAYGNSRMVIGWNNYSSLESELTKIDYIASEAMMGDQSFNHPFGHFTSNAYYQSTAPFSTANFTGQSAMRLTARLDGFSVSDVTSAIDRAQHAFVGPSGTPGGPFHFIVDNDPTITYAPPMANLANQLAALEMPLTYDNTGAFVSSSGGPLLGYTGHGDHQASTPPGYIYAISDPLADGAVFNSWESYNAQSFTQGGNSGNQALVGEWLNRGGTAAVGNVAEPGASPNGVINEDQLFGMLLEGRTFAEAAWSGARQLSYVNTVVGDPLMTWRQLLPGDATMDGFVDARDLKAMGKNWGKSVTPGGYGWAQGDLNGDGLVDFADLALLDGSWGAISSWAQGQATIAAPLGSPLAMALYGSLYQTPEPASAVLFGFGAIPLVALFWRRRTHRRTRRP